MKPHQFYQAATFLSYLSIFSISAANPLPENSYGSDPDYLSMFNNDDSGSSNLNLDDGSLWGSDPSDQILPFDSTYTTGLSDSNPIGGFSIADGSALKAPYCGTTEKPVCCADVLSYIGCKDFDPWDADNCDNEHQGCCARIVGGIGHRCYRGSPGWVQVVPDPQEAPKDGAPGDQNTIPLEQPATPSTDGFDWDGLWHLLPFTGWGDGSPSWAPI